MAKAERDANRHLLRATQNFKRRWIYATLGLAGLALVMGGVGYWSARGGKPERAVASAEKNEKDAKKDKTLAEVETEVKKKDFEQKKAKEWVWGEAGNTELIIQAYREVNAKGARGHEDRTRMLNALARTARPRAQWPAAFSAAKAGQVLDFLNEVLAQDHSAGSDGLSAINVLTVYGQLMPEYRKQAQKSILAYYAADTRLAPRGACLDALSKLQSAQAIPLLKTAVRSSEYSTSRSAMYSLANYLGTPLEAAPRDTILDVARKNAPLRPLAVKLLAFHGNRSVASFVPKLLGKGASPAEIEAGAYVVEQLKLKQYAGLLENQPVDSPFLQQQLEAARKASK